jgi:hydroxymethylpyrimidine/phosphomethylpyrimidine kinase
MTSLLVIAGLDPSGGAGLLADCRVAAEHGVRAVGVVTATTVQDTAGVRAVELVAPEVLGEALTVLLGDVEVDAVKIGMLGDARTAEVVARALAATRAPVVWDPVIRPSRGGVPLLAGDPARAARALLDEVRLVTPNVAEAGALSGIAVVDEDSARAAAAAIGAAAVLIKGGHLAGGRARDVLRDGSEVTILDAPRVDAGPVHGTGCVLSSAIACRLALGASLVEAVRAAKDYLGAKLAAPLAVGRGARCLV